MTVICPRCNAQSSDDALYCTVCGMTLGGAIRASAMEQKPAPEPNDTQESPALPEPPAGAAAVVDPDAPSGGDPDPILGAGDDHEPPEATDNDAQPGADLDSDRVPDDVQRLEAPIVPTWEPIPAWTTAHLSEPGRHRDLNDGDGRGGGDDDFIPLQLPERQSGGVRGVMDRGIGRSWLVLSALLLLGLVGAVAWGAGVFDGGADDDPVQTPTVSSIAMGVPATASPMPGTPGVSARGATPASTSDRIASTPVIPGIASPAAVESIATPGDRATPAPAASATTSTVVAFPQQIASPEATPAAVPAMPGASPEATPTSSTAVAATPGASPASTPVVIGASTPVSEPSPVAGATDHAERAGDAISGASAVVSSSTPAATPSVPATATDAPAVETPAPAGDGTGGASVPPLPTQPAGD